MKGAVEDWSGRTYRPRFLSRRHSAVPCLVGLIPSRRSRAATGPNRGRDENPPRPSLQAVHDIELGQVAPVGVDPETAVRRDQGARSAENSRRVRGTKLPHELLLARA